MVKLLTKALESHKHLSWVSDPTKGTSTTLNYDPQVDTHCLQESEDRQLGESNSEIGRETRHHRRKTSTADGSFVTHFLHTVHRYDNDILIKNKKSRVIMTGASVARNRSYFLTTIHDELVRKQRRRYSATTGSGRRSIWKQRWWKHNLSFWLVVLRWLIDFRVHFVLQGATQNPPTSAFGGTNTANTGGSLFGGGGECMCPPIPCSY